MYYCSFVYIFTPFLLLSHSFLLVAFSSHLWRFQLMLQLIGEGLSAPFQKCCVSWDPLMHLLAEKKDSWNLAIPKSGFPFFLRGGLRWDGVSCDLWWVSARAYSLQQLQDYSSEIPASPKHWGQWLMLSVV